MCRGHNQFGVTAKTMMRRLSRVVGVAMVMYALAAAIGARSTGAQQTSQASAAAPDAQTLFQGGIKLLQSGKTDEAIHQFEQALSIAPQDKVVLNALGGAYSAKGDSKVARNYFIRSLDADPDFIPARQNLGITLFSLGDYAAAELDFRIILDNPGSSKEIPDLFLGMIAQKHSNCSDALNLLKGAGELLYQYPEAALAYAQCADESGDKVGAKTALDALERTPSATAAERQQGAALRARLTRGVQPMMAKNTQERADSAVSSSPSADSLMDVARAAKERGDLSTALKTLKRVSELAPDREDSYLEFSAICADHNSDALALQAAELGLSHVPNSYGLTVQRGVVLDKLGRLPEAESVLHSAITLSAENSIALLSLAVVYAHEGKVSSAEQTLADAIARFPGNYYMHYFRGKLLLGFPDGSADRDSLRNLAQTSLEASIRLNPEYADSYYQLSTILTDDSPKAAEAALNKCLKLDPNHIPAKYALARLYIRTGRKAEGQALMETLKSQQRTEELQQQKQLLIEVAQN